MSGGEDFEDKNGKEIPKQNEINSEGEAPN